MKLDTLYGRSKSGKIKQWTVSVIQMGDGTCYVETEHGYVDGKKQVDQRYVGEGKNIGRANETTPYEQACSEAQSAYNRKADEGYVEDKNNIPKASDGLFLPMLAQSYDKHHKKIKFPCWVQPKLDGMRMLAKKENGEILLWTRKGKPIETLEEIKSQLSPLLKEGEATDGEVYVHGWTFQRIISAIKKVSDDTPLLEYHIYDAPHTELIFEARFAARFLPEVTGEVGPNIKIVDTTPCYDADEFSAAESKYIEQGYEGMMARNAASPYKYKNRTFDLQKVKRFVDDEFRIIGGKDGSGRESGLVVFRCVTEGGLEFDVRPRGSHELRAQMFENLNDYIDKPLTVRYQELTDDGVPRFPVGIAVRDYE